MIVKKLVMIISVLTGLIICVSCSQSKINVGKSKSVSSADASTLTVPFQETHWKLIELMDKPLDTSKNLKEMYIIFKSKGNRVEGNGGCNTFASSYTSKGSSIALGEMISTKMYCPGIGNENAFFIALSKADHYSVKDDTLILSNQFIPKLATFVAEP